MPSKVLIADDDRTLLTSLSVRLRAAGYEVQIAADSYQALAAARTGSPPDVMLLDINMPAGDGFTVQERMGKIGEASSIPTIYLTGERSARVEQMATAQRAFAVVFKPFETDELLSVIKEAIEFKAKQRAA